MAEPYVVGLRDISAAHAALVGGKAAHLGALAAIPGVRVPDGFCVTTAAFRRFTTDIPSWADDVDRLSRDDGSDGPTTSEVAESLRRDVAAAPIPTNVAAAITSALARYGEEAAYAVRSSATAEDLPTASFAGQQDTYLNVVGSEEVLAAVRRCWTSLVGERAVAYRRRHGIDHRASHMAVVVQHLVAARAAGILFTADPLSGHRRVAVVEAAFGLGDAVVSGLVDVDAYRVVDGEVVEVTVGTKQVEVRPVSGGGTRQGVVDPRRRRTRVLTDDEAVRLAALGRRIEAALGSPQDIEWCLADGTFQVVQSRPITTLFPVPESSDGQNHVYLSVGHQQMMTDAMRPLGLSFWQMTTPAPMTVAGGRLFVDVTPRLAVPSTREALLEVIDRSDPLTGDALRTVLDRDGFIRPLPDEDAPPPLHGGPPAPIETDPAIVTELIAQSRESIAACAREIRAMSGPALVDFIRTDMMELRRILFDPRSHRVFMSAMEAAWWLNEHLAEWLGERNAADALTQSVPHNVTSEMGLALLDVADVIRPHADVVAFLADVGEPGFLDALPGVPGGAESAAAIQAWLDAYGMRCVGEIDITRERWSERPDALVPLILANIGNFEPGESRRRVEQGLQQASQREREILAALRAVPDGELRATETRQRIDRVRTFIGYREYPKYGMVSRYSLYKQALLREADSLVALGVLEDREDIYYLTFDEVAELIRTHEVDARVVEVRRAEFQSYQALTPPRVLTSDGEAIVGAYRRDDVPPGAFVGLPVSAGTVEGRARVVLDIHQADLRPGDILVTSHTDPSWTPLFVSAGGLVTEVGGSMTHGAVIAREYGLPAVVSVVDATRLIPDGRRIRVHGTSGFVEFVD